MICFNVLRHPVFSRDPSKRTLLVLALAIVATLLPAFGAASYDASAPSVVIVLSHDDVYHREAAKAAVEALRAGGRASETVVIANVTTSMLESWSQDRVGVIALGTRAAAALHQKLDATVPLTYALVSNPDRVGLTKGRTTVGVSTWVSVEDQFDLIKEALPSVRRIGVLYDSASAEGRRGLKDAEAVKGSWELIREDVQDHETVPDAIRALLDKGPDIVWTMSDTKLFDTASSRVLLLEGLRRRIPVFGYKTSFVRSGALLGVGILPTQQGRQAADALLDWLTEGSPDNRPVYARTIAPHYEIAINRLVAKRLSLEVGKAALRRADHVFE